MNLKGKKALVVGIQSSGISASYLLKREGAEVFLYDDNQTLNISGFEFLHNKTYDEMANTVDMAVISPSISKFHPIMESFKKFRVPVISELALGASFLDCNIIAVTGTNGKTTCVTMIEKLLTFSGLKTKAMGNIGYPVSQVVLDGTELDWAVIEVSSFQLEHAESFHPNIAVILNLAPDHLDRYFDYRDYVWTKRKICKNQTEKDYLVYNNEDGEARSFIKSTAAVPCPVSVRSRMGEAYIKDNFYMLGENSVCHVKDCRLRGEHNKFNLLIAMNVGFLCGAKKENMARLIKEYTLLPNRIEYVSTIDGKNYYNDSKGTNIHAGKYAIGSLDGTVGLIMGGSDKNEDFCEFFENIDEKVKYVAITGANAEKIYNSAMKMGFVEAEIFPDLAACVQKLSGKPGIDNVLLSPCCASFDRYKSYVERGERFKEIVYAIKV